MLSPKGYIDINPLPTQHSGTIPEEGTKRKSELGDKECCAMLTFGHNMAICNHEFTAADVTWTISEQDQASPNSSMDRDELTRPNFYWGVHDCWGKESSLSLRVGLLTSLLLQWVEWPVPVSIKAVLTEFNG